MLAPDRAAAANTPGISGLFRLDPARFRCTRDEFTAALVAEGDYSYRSGLRATRELLDLPGPPTAIFAANDDMAAAAVAVAHRRNLNVPEDLSICGFDDTAIATTVWPELTTIRQPVAEMARRAARLLADAVARPLDAPVQTRHERVDFSLVRRASHGSP